MGPKTIHYSDVELRSLEGRDVRLIINENTFGSKELSGGIVWLEPSMVTKPCHAHMNEEEVVYTTKGDGEVWVDGETATVRAGDFIFFPKGSRHMLRNSGGTTMQFLFIFAPPIDPSKYKQYPEVDFT